MRGLGSESPTPSTSIACSAGPGAASAHASTSRPQNVRSMPTPIGGRSTRAGRPGVVAGTTVAP